MEIVVVGRHTEVADRFREHAEENSAKSRNTRPRHGASTSKSPTNTTPANQHDPNG